MLTAVGWTYKHTQHSTRMYNTHAHTHTHTGTATIELLTDSNKLLMAVGGATALFLGIYGARESSRVVGGAVERWLGTPSLVSVC